MEHPPLVDHFLRHTIGLVCCMVSETPKSRLSPKWTIETSRTTARDWLQRLYWYPGLSAGSRMVSCSEGRRKRRRNHGLDIVKLTGTMANTCYFTADQSVRFLFGWGWALAWNWMPSMSHCNDWLQFWVNSFATFSGWDATRRRKMTRMTRILSALGSEKMVPALYTQWF